MEQLDYFIKKQESASPTLSVKELKADKILWVSMLGDRAKHGYLIGYISPKEKKASSDLERKKQCVG